MVHDKRDEHGHDDPRFREGRLQLKSGRKHAFLQQTSNSIGWESNAP
jgi:hypothetical protein